MKKPEQVTIRQLIDTRKVFFVPKYQRTYAWEDEEIDDFIKDIENLYNVRLSAPKKHMNHFLGGFVTIEQDEPDTQPAHKYQVVDGQQRLSTFLIALSLLSQAFKEMHEESDNTNEQSKALNFANKTQEYLRYKRLDNHTGVETKPLRLTLSKTDTVYFEKIVDAKIDMTQPEPSSGASHKRLFYAYKQISSKLIDTIILDSDLSSSGKIDRLVKLHQVLLDDCYVIHIISETLSEGYRLFSILNDRGQRLTDADLLRSHTLSILEDTLQQARVEKYWDHLAEGTFEQVDGFLRAYYVSCEGKRPSRGGLYDDYIKKYFDYRIGTRVNDEIEAQRIASKIEEMSNEWDCYIKLSNGTWPYTQSQLGDWYRNRVYLLMKTLRHDLCVPLLMSAAQKFDEQRFADLISLLERFYFRYKIIVNEHMGAIGNIYYEYAKGIREGDPKYTINNLRKDLNEKVSQKASDEIFKLKLVDELVYQERSTNRKNAIRYFLMTLEDYLQWYKQGYSGKLKPNDRGDLDISKLTIEHIYPNNPDPPHRDIGEIKNDVGNLALLGRRDNDKQKNKPPTDKKFAYKNENKISLTSGLVDQLDNWDVQAIERRQKYLIKIALKVFAI